MIIYIYTPGCAIDMSKPHQIEIAEQLDQRILDLLAAPVLWYELQMLIITVIDQPIPTRRLLVRRRSHSSIYIKLYEFCECNHGSWLFIDHG